MKLSDIAGKYDTDKNTTHSYIDQVYEDLFFQKRDNCKKILEIGIQTGSSLLMWRDYFENAEIFGIDIDPCDKLENEPKIRTFVGNAYSKESVNLFSNDFDIIIDDGPHTFQSMSYFILNYVRKIKNDGIAIIEDILSPEWAKVLKVMVPNNYDVQIKDLRNVKHRYDDIIMIITKK